MRARSKIYLGAILALVINAAPVEAQTFIAAGCDDANNCGRAAPCRSLQRGVNATRAGRVLTILDSGDYGPATIGKSITVAAEGISANIRAASGTSAITINNAAATVVLRGLFLTGGGVGATGIFITQAAAVHIEDCQIERFTGAGILLPGADTELLIADTVSRANGDDGLRVEGEGTTARLTVDNSRFENNGGDGLEVRGARSTITRSVASGNGGHGILHIGGNTSVSWTTTTNNAGDGIAQGDGDMSVSWTTATNNAEHGYAVTDGGVMIIESSVGSKNAGHGLYVMESSSYALISTSVLMDNTLHSIRNDGFVQTRRNNTFSSAIGANALTSFPSQ